MVKKVVALKAEPAKFSKALFDSICEKIADGKSVREICEMPGMPDRTNFRRWCKGTPELQAAYDQAKIDREEAIFDDIQWIADHDKDPKSAKVRIDAREWTLARMNGKKYGNRVTNEHTGEGGGPVVIAATSLDEKL